MPRKPKKLPRGISERKPGVYWIQYFDANRQRHREKAGPLSSAQNLLAVRHSERLAGKLPERAIKKSLPLVKDLIADAIAASASENSAEVTYDITLRLNYMKKKFGNRPIESLKRHEIMTWLDGLKKKHKWKASTYNRWKAAVSKVFTVGIQNEKISKNPVSTIRRQQEANNRIRYLTAEEESALVAVLRRDVPGFLPVFIMSIHTGMRRSEQFRGMVGDLNYETKLLTVHQKKDRNKRMVRYVPLTSIAIEAYEELAKGKKIGDLLCVNSEGVMKTTAYWFKGAVDLAGIVDYHWHDNRHTACSRWAMGDVPLASIAQYVGHATIQMTMRYAHLMPDQHTKDLEKMMAFYAKPVARAEEQSATRSATGTFGASAGSSKSL